MSTHDDDALSAQQRLARSREAMLQQLQGKSRKNQTFTDATGRVYSADPTSEAFSTDDGVLSMLKRAGAMWWHFHPARRAMLLAEPMLERYARRRPWQVVGVAAGVGAVLVILRPWKLLSFGGLAMAALRSSELSSVAVALMRSPKTADTATTTYQIDDAGDSAVTTRTDPTRLPY